MTYKRVIPRDLFNEASLLKCLGRIYILLETGTHNARLDYAVDEGDYREAEQYGEPAPGWNICQNESTGGIYADNVILWIGGKIAYLERPLNSRQDWPLWLERLDGEELEEPVEVFDKAGNFSPEMLALIGWEAA